MWFDSLLDYFRPCGEPHSRESVIERRSAAAKLAVRPDP
jgi:hypothetical protein